MSISRRSSNASAPFRFEWRPSRWLAGALGVLGLLGAYAVLASELPRVAGWPLAIAALCSGWRQARRELRRAPRTLRWAADGGLTIDGEEAGKAQLQWRGPLAFLHWRDHAGRRQALAWWPDTLDVPRRRELRLAAARATPVASRPSMAP